MQSFNLCDQKWIPSTKGQISLFDVFEKDCRLAGNAIEKLSIFNLLKAIAQAAETPETEEQWLKITPEVLAEKVLIYLKRRHMLFDIYDQEKPFLQFPQLRGRIKPGPVNSVAVTDLSGNATVLFNSQRKREFTDAEKARLIVSQMGFAKSGKATDNSISLTPGYEKKKGSATGSSLGFMGFLHNHIMVPGSTIRSLWLNLYSKESALSYISNLSHDDPIGNPAWDRMPQGEKCRVAEHIQESVVGQLVPMSRFMLLEKEQVYITEGVRHKLQTEGRVDPTVAIDISSSKPKVIWARPDKKPWRELPALLSFLSSEKKGFNCPQLKMASSRLNASNLEKIEIWSSGASVTANAGEQYFSGKNDFIDSSVAVETDVFGEVIYVRLKLYFSLLEEIGKKLYSAVLGFFNDLGEGDSVCNKKAAACTEKYWSECEKGREHLFRVASEYEFYSDEALNTKRFFLAKASIEFDRSCQKGTARQIAVWAKRRPDSSWLKQKKEKK